MDKIVSKITSLGVGGLILTYIIGTSSFVGAAALTAGLASFGPGGMIGGILTLGMCILISQAIAEYGLDKLFGAIVVELKRKGMSYEEIKTRIEKAPISKDLKIKLYIHLGLNL